MDEKRKPGRPWLDIKKVSTTYQLSPEVKAALVQMARDFGERPSAIVDRELQKLLDREGYLPDC